MKHLIKLLAAVIVIVSSGPASAVDPTLINGSPGIPITYAETGIYLAALTNTPRTMPIDMEATRATNQLALTLTIKPGNSTAVTVQCYEGESTASGGLGLISKCVSSTCSPDVRTYTLNDYPTVPASVGVKTISSRWIITKRYVSCSATASGTGNVTITGTRSWQ